MGTIRQLLLGVNVVVEHRMLSLGWI